MKYLSYEPEDFAADSYFCRWVRQPDAENEAFWQDWLQTYPHKAQDVSIARQLVLLTVQDNDSDPSDEVVDRMWQTIKSRRSIIPSKVIEHPAVRRRYGILIRVAASVALVLVAAGGFYIWQNRSVTYATEFGESRRIKLPDGSNVNLNAHSTLRTRANWSEQNTREVWISGEAFFNVAKRQWQGSPVKFVVHTNDLDIEVKGTQFNVNTRQEQTKVVLSEGRIDLKLANDQPAKPLQMQPGDAVIFSRQSHRLAINHLAEPQKSHSWTDNRWTLDNTRLDEVATMIEESYGLKVTFQQDALAKQRINGVIPTDNLKDLLSALESILHIKVDKQGDQLIIRPIP